MILKLKTFRRKIITCQVSGNLDLYFVINCNFESGLHNIYYNIKTMINHNNHKKPSIANVNSIVLTFIQSATIFFKFMIFHNVCKS